jgi:two-component system sensor histidine kinase and response regulator WspE
MNKKILVVDDHHDTSLLLCRLFKSEGYDVQHAMDGLVGLSSANREHPDLIVTDVQMPRMDGIEMIRRLRQSAEMRKVPIIVISAYGRQVMKDAIEAGADEFVAKPLDYEKLMMSVRSRLQLPN